MIKKLIKLMVVSMMILMIVGCSSQETDKDTTTDSNETSKEETPNLTSSDNVLIAYFSWSGNTETLANMIHEKG